MEVINYLKRNNGSGHIVEHVGWHESGDYLLRLLFSQSENPFRQHKWDVEKEYNVIDKAEVDALERQTCARRMGELGPWGREENTDYWRSRETEPNSRTCSFCGSLHPDDVIARIKEHGLGIIERTTKSYKWYVGPGFNKYYHMHNTDAFIETFNGIVKNQAS